MTTKINYLCNALYVNQMEQKERTRIIYKATWIGSVVNLLLVLLKFAAGIIGHSAAMIADAVHSLSDFITDIVVLVFVHISNKPQDRYLLNAPGYDRNEHTSNGGVKLQLSPF